MGVNSLILARKVGTTNKRIDVAPFLTRFDVDMSTAEQTDLNIEMTDPGHTLLASGVIERQQQLLWGNLRCEVAAVETGGSGSIPSVTLHARAFHVQQFKRAKATQNFTNISPTDYLRMMVQKVGGRMVAQPTAKRQNIITIQSGDDAQSVWDVMRGFASEEGFLFFEAAGVFYFGKPSWLIKRPAVWEMNYKAVDNRNKIVILDTPDCRMSEDAKEGSTVSLIVDRLTGTKVRPGDLANFLGFPKFSGKYMVESVNWDQLSLIEPVAITLVSPIDPEKRDASTPGGSSTTPSATTSGPYAHVAAAAKAAGWVDNPLITAIAIAIAESGGNVKAHNSTPPDDSYGLWQINMLGKLGTKRRAQYGIKANTDLYDPMLNARIAYRIWKESGNSFKHWTTYTRGTYKQYMDEAWLSLVPPPQSGAANPPPTNDTSTTGGGLKYIGQGSHRLRADAAQGFERFKQAYGRNIPITDSYRDYNQQLQAWRSDPARFAHPDKSWHCKGLAIDVNLKSLGIAGYKGEKALNKLVAAGAMAGWHWIGSNSRGKFEPWHFSYGGRG